MTRPLIALLGLVLALAAAHTQAQFSAAGGAAAESAAERALQRDGVASYGHRNLYRAGRTVRTGAPVEGDFHAAGSRVVVDADVKGDAILIGGAVEVRNPVGGDLRTAAGKLIVDAPIEGDVLIAGSEIALERGTRIGRDALIAGRSVDVRGSIDGELTIYAQHIVIAGSIGGRTRLVAEEIELLDGARIRGTLSYTSPNEIKRAAGATVDGEVTRREAEKKPEPAPAAEHDDDDGWGLLGALLWMLGLFVFGVVLTWISPSYSAEAARRAWSDPLAALGVGFALLIALPVAAGLAIVTIIGIPLGASALALYPVLLLAGYLTGVTAVAQRLRLTLGPKSPPSAIARLLWLAVTLTVLLVVGLVPFLGWLLSAWVLLAGMGGLVLAARTRRMA
jgi:cytoskeletal protein CcmA (bactofilin family)